MSNNEDPTSKFTPSAQQVLGLARRAAKELGQLSKHKVRPGVGGFLGKRSENSGVLCRLKGQKPYSDWLKHNLFAQCIVRFSFRYSLIKRKNNYSANVY